MKCKYCNTELKKGAKFCPNCGKEVIDFGRCIKCGEYIKTGALFCPQCGAKQQMEDLAVDDNSQQETVITDSFNKEDAVIHEQETIKEIEEPQDVVRNATQDEDVKCPTSETPTDNVTDTFESYESGHSSKRWLWILGIILLLGIVSGGWYFFNGGYKGNEVMPPIEETDSIAEVSDSTDTEMNNYDTPTAMAFLEQFYKGDYEDYDYIKKHVTEYVLNKLRDDYDYDDCEKCLATWVFSAYPAGGDMNLEEGPILFLTDTEGKYRIDFNYSFYDGENKGYETRTVFVTVTQIDGKYFISDYEIEENNPEDNVLLDSLENVN